MLTQVWITVYMVFNFLFKSQWLQAVGYVRQVSCILSPVQRWKLYKIHTVQGLVSDSLSGRACVCSLLIRQAGGTTVSCVCERVAPDLLPPLNCYYSVRSCCVFLRKGSYFISSFCPCLNVSDALSAIFAHFNSLLHPNENIHPCIGL